MSDKKAVECVGQMRLTCEQCEGERLIKSDDTPTEVCDECDGSGIDPYLAYELIVVASFYEEHREFLPPTPAS